MKNFLFLSFLLAANHGADAWTVGPRPSTKSVATKTEKPHNGWVAAAAAATLTLATITTPIASATTVDQPLSLDQHPTMLVAAAGAYQAEESYMSTDLSMPTYNTENSADLIKAEKPVKEAAPKKAASLTKQKNRAPRAGTAEESPAARERRLQREAEEDARAAEKAAKDAEKEAIVAARKQADFEKAAAAKQAKLDKQAKRLEQRGKVATLE
ncbi:expressed unknown protein [Seminavis robusta]|uniref:Uncharacterized protein n=1 Tax=Seminavis robusta TaxID=568900 RepID=A0A9N8DRR3_9STRA|nr:expressed unknown protein [Seminavis robusta]|eukprot:Sro308_g113580.1 n/a (213) ;mRNA; f:40220-40949